MSDSLTLITKAQFEAAVGVWLRTIPPSIWRDLEAFEQQRKIKRQAENYDPRDHVAKYIAGKFEQAGWTAISPLRTGHG